MEKQGYYCGGNIEVRGKPNYYQDIGPRYRRADVAGVRNIDNPFEDQIEIVAVEVRDKTKISDRDISDTVNYRQYAHKCYLATTAPIEDKDRRTAERRNIGLLKLEKGKREPIPVRHPTPENPKSHVEMMAFLNSFEIIKCSICGCFFERFVRPDEKYHSYFEVSRAKYFKVMSETDDDPLDLSEIRKLPSRHRIRRYICTPCLEELFLDPRRIERIKRKRKEEEEYHARWNREEKGFECNVGKTKACKDYVYNNIDIVEHLQEEHDIDPDDQDIDGWTDDDEQAWEKYRSKKE